ncbi:MAG: nuclease-related domain-containing protein [Roseateles sp.]|uniref:nuclease-related domain-containing protein n=1 Tax=Roseateles sp. TaxID=1971397 RepID=UPI0039EB7A9D
MLIKQADDKTKRLKLLEDLQASPVLDARQRAWLKDEYWNVKRGIEGERDAAFHIDSVLRDGRNNAVLHDLRIVVGDDVAQIDHLIVGRMLDIFLVETKCYAGNVLINEAGEFTVEYESGKRFGIPSPLAQSQRHARVLAKLLEHLGIGGRIGTEPKFHHVVMLHPKAIIQRPDPKRYDTSHVIKADQFPEWRTRWVNDLSPLAALAGVFNLHGQDTVREWGEKIARQHRPSDLLALPEFMRPRVHAPVAPAPVRVPAPAPAVPAVQVPENGAEPAKKLICARCGARISFAEGKFCWGQSRRFGGLQYCREHQAAFPR